MKRCGTPEIECPQTSYSWIKGTLCYYHTKLDRGLLVPVNRYLGETELDSMFGGRTRNDGRRLDNYTRT